MGKAKPRCTICKEETCFAYYKGFCSILTNTQFKRKCPFYKPKEEHKEESVKVSK